jgi:hypothetical protein
MSAPLAPRALSQAQRQDAFTEVANWLFRRYTEGAIAANLARAGARKPEAQPRLVAAAPRMASTLERHREPFSTVIGPALRGAFDERAAAQLVQRIRQTPLTLDADMGRRLVTVDQELRRNGQAVLAAILADIDLITDEILEGG